MARSTLLIDNGITACMTGWIIIEEAHFYHLALGIYQERGTEKCGS